MDCDLLAGVQAEAARGQMQQRAAKLQVRIMSLRWR